MIKIRAFRAIDDIDSCFNFLAGHQRILEIYGITKITSNNHDWIYNPGTIVIMVENEDRSKVYGGARIHLYDGENALPIQTAVSNYDPKIDQLVEKGSSEICGLWNSKEVIGMGIGSIILGRVTSSLTSRLPIKKTFMLCAPATVKMCSRVGCTLITEIGNNGLFYYPKDDLIATAMIIPDPDTLIHAEDNERELIFNLRNNPIQEKLEKGPKGEYKVEYNLELPEMNYSDFFLLKAIKRVL